MSSASDEALPLPTKKITLKTADGKYFDVEESVAMEFAAVKNFFDDSTAETAKEMVVPLPNVSAKCLTQIMEYCGKQLKFRAMSGSEDAKNEYDKSFLNEINNEEIKELILAVNYLEVKYLLDVLTNAVAKRIENKSVEYVRKFFAVESDFTPEEEAQLHQEHAWAFENVDPDD
ncbi:SKP1-like protein 14 [Ricinus communis]|uniref:SKP1-like protein n=1 Tax=Ricinus communis TaxID=3988 RepID=B9RHZ0_RICCO|nr:SKP1-like protein 14 [Ricinus communis]EEF48762.1 skp1, putative [Ricinus communis]|eukprot:XP_002513359.1 SKP1-like protein 14 [Ricinus communis]